MNSISKNMLILIIFSLIQSKSIAATLLELKTHHALYKLRSLIIQKKLMLSNTDSHLPVNIQETTRELDFNHALHIRAQQFIDECPVWDSQFIIHITNVSENLSKKPLEELIRFGHLSLQGHIYENLNLDLPRLTLEFLQNVQKQKALQHISKIYFYDSQIKDLKTKLIIYIDKNKKAHWAYLISYFETNNETIQRPTFIIDALTFRIYKSWNDMKRLEPVQASGIGGNPKTKYFYYDNQPNHFAALNIERDGKTQICYLQNAFIILKDINDNAYFFKCDYAQNLNLYPIPNEEINGAYSPRNDLLFNVDLTQKMFKEWYGISFMNEEEFKFSQRSIDRFEFMFRENLPGAFYYEKKFFIGLGNKNFYPYTDLDVIAHELSHHFTALHSNLFYSGESGAINESFSDMAAKAAEFYLHNKNNWSIESNIHKNNDDAERYFDQPSKNCAPDKKPGERCSIDSYTQYQPNLEIHYASGIFDRVFYLMATAPHWNTKKAFDVMVKANMHYWKENSDFHEAACGILQAAKDYHYDPSAVQSALLSVGMKTSNC